MFTRKILLDVTNSLAAIKDDLDQQLETINDNSREIDENRMMISNLHEQLCKLRDVVNVLASETTQERVTVPPSIELGRKEQDVFTAVYTATGPLTYGFLSRQVGQPLSVVRETIFEIIRKGVPIVKLRDEAGNFLLALDAEFKELQAKYKMVRTVDAIKYAQSSLIE